jgi:hypothetical protein
MSDSECWPSGQGTPEYDAMSPLLNQFSESNWTKDWISYRWGWEVFRTARRYGLGVELHVNGSFLIALRLGPWMVSWGQQIVFKDYSNSTTTRSE